ncbi:MAG: hypothetical protein PWP31_765 [Clostridia bacterium]|nr:hypothetical protein [Clostridia bacterium]
MSGFLLFGFLENVNYHPFTIIDNFVAILVKGFYLVTDRVMGWAITEHTNANARRDFGLILVLL